MITDPIITETHGRKLASVQSIDGFIPIPDADSLEIAKMENLGWDVVVRRGEFNPGQLVVYFEVDSFIRVRNLLKSMEFLKDRALRKFTNGKNTILEEGCRIKTIKLRGQISEGLVLDWKTVAAEVGVDPSSYNVGDDLTALLKVEHFDEVKDFYDEMGGHVKAPDAAGLFPSFVPKTDETRLQSLMKYFGVYEHSEFEVTEKFDGSSYTFVYAPTRRADNPFYLCSRNQEKKVDPSNVTWSTITNGMTLQDKMVALYSDKASILCGHELALQGEFVGPGLNSNRDHYSEHHWKIFRIFDITDGKFLSPAMRYVVCGILGLEHVKVIENTMKVFEKFKTVDDFIAYVQSGKTDHGLEREGFVFKKVDDGSVSFKVINPLYLIKEK